MKKNWHLRESSGANAITCLPGWLTTLFAAIPKKRKPLSEVNSYRTVGLESCFLKLICLLIQKWIYDWAEAKGIRIIPPSQNGFREKYRTNNNAFVLQCMIERARAEGRTLWVAFLDITIDQSGFALG
jgi:hypothetical protein